MAFPNKTQQKILDQIENELDHMHNRWSLPKHLSVSLVTGTKRSYISTLIAYGYLALDNYDHVYRTDKPYDAQTSSKTPKKLNPFQRLQLLSKEQAADAFKVSQTTEQDKVSELETRIVKRAVLSFTSKPMSVEDAEMFIIEAGKIFAKFKKK